MKVSKIFGARLSAVVLLAILAGIAAPERAGGQEEPERKNVVYLMTDDQDFESAYGVDDAGAPYMPNLKREIVDKGKRLDQYAFSDPLCCPSRASQFTGRYPHNTGVHTNRNKTGGGYLGYQRGGGMTENIWVPLDRAGYRVGYVGKYVNDYGVGPGRPGYRPRAVPNGIDYWYSRYLNHGWFEDPDGSTNDGGGKDAPVRYSEPRGNADTIANARAVRFVRESAARDEPFALVVSWKAAHDGCDVAKVDSSLYKEEDLNKDPSYAEGSGPGTDPGDDKPAWVRAQQPLTAKEDAAVIAQNKIRLRCLQTVDRGIGEIVDALEETGEMPETYLLFGTDNGYHLGHHGLNASKEAPYETDVAFPMVVRGPGVPVRVDDVTNMSNVDVGPTMWEIAGATPTYQPDGRSALAGILAPEGQEVRGRQLVEHRTSQRKPAPTYQQIRDRDFKYIRYASGEEEAYDLAADPHELRSVARDPAYAPQMDHYRSKLPAMANCAGDGCREAEDSP